MGRTLLVFTILLISLAGSPAWAAKLYSLHIGSFDSRAQMAKAASDLEGLNDLWIEKNQGKIHLLAGIFPSRRYAKLLLDHLEALDVQAEIVETQMPRSNQWLRQEYIVRLRDIGYDRPLLLAGVDAYQAFSFPWDTNMELKGSFLQIDMNISRFLKPTSSVTIKAEGVPLWSMSVGDLRAKPQIKIPLDALSGIDIGDSLDIELSGSLSATDNRCVDIMSKNLWIMTATTSSLHTFRKGPPRSIRQFFSEPVPIFNIVLEGKDRSFVEALIKVAGLIGSTSVSNDSRMQFDNFSLQGRNIFIGNFNNEAEVVGSNLFLTPKGARLVASRWLPAFVFPTLNGGEIGKPHGDKAIDISFADLGYGHRTARGDTDLSFFVDFSPLQLGGWPRRLLCTLFFSHSPIGEHERCFLRIRLNGVLLESHELHGAGGQHSLVFEIPARYLHERNYLEIAFSHYLNTGNCLGSYPDFEVSLFKDSFLSVAAYNTRPPLNLDTFPGIFQGRGALVIGRMEPQFFLPASRLVELLGHLQKQVPDVTLTNISDLDSDAFKYALLVLDEKTWPHISAPVEIGPRFIIKNPLTGEEIIRIDTPDPASIVETFYLEKNDLPVFLYGRRNSSVFPSEALTRMISGHPRANVGIIHQKQWYALEVGKKFRVVYPDKRGLEYYWTRYRIILFIVFGAAAMVFFFYLYHRLAKEK